jgi:hypothetical protein
MTEVEKGQRREKLLSEVLLRIEVLRSHSGQRRGAGGREKTHRLRLRSLYISCETNRDLNLCDDEVHVEIVV